MGEIVPLLQELKNIILEIDRIGYDLKSLKVKKVQLENQIEEFLNADNQTGVIYKDVAVMVKEKKARKSKKVVERRNDAIKTLAEFGVSNPELVLSKIIESMKGEPYIKKVLKVEDKNKKKKH